MASSSRVEKPTGSDAARSSAAKNSRPSLHVGDIAAPGLVVVRSFIPSLRVALISLGAALALGVLQVSFSPWPFVLDGCIWATGIVLFLILTHWSILRIRRAVADNWASTDEKRQELVFPRLPHETPQLMWLCTVIIAILDTWHLVVFAPGADDAPMSTRALLWMFWAYAFAVTFVVLLMGRPHHGVVTRAVLACSTGAVSLVGVCVIAVGAPGSRAELDALGRNSAASNAALALLEGLSVLVLNDTMMYASLDSLENARLALRQGAQSTIAWGRRSHEVERKWLEARMEATSRAILLVKRREQVERAQMKQSVGTKSRSYAPTLEVIEENHDEEQKAEQSELRLVQSSAPPATMRKGSSSELDIDDRFAALAAMQKKDLYGNPLDLETMDAEIKVVPRSSSMRRVPSMDSDPTTSIRPSKKHVALAASILGKVFATPLPRISYGVALVAVLLTAQSAAMFARGNWHAGLPLITAVILLSLAAVVTHDAMELDIILHSPESGPSFSRRWLSTRQRCMQGAMPCAKAELLSLTATIVHVLIITAHLNDIGQTGTHATGEERMNKCYACAIELRAGFTWGLILAMVVIGFGSLTLVPSRSCDANAQKLAMFFLLANGAIGYVAFLGAAEMVNTSEYCMGELPSVSPLTGMLGSQPVVLPLLMLAAILGRYNILKHACTALATSIATQRFFAKQLKAKIKEEMRDLKDKGVPGAEQMNLRLKRSKSQRSSRRRSTHEVNKPKNNKSRSHRSESNSMSGESQTSGYRASLKNRRSGSHSRSAESQTSDYKIALTR